MGHQGGAPNKRSPIYCAPGPPRGGRRPSEVPDFYSGLWKSQAGHLPQRKHLGPPPGTRGNRWERAGGESGRARRPPHAKLGAWNSKAGGCKKSPLRR